MLLAGCIDNGWSELRLAWIQDGDRRPEVIAPTSAAPGEPVVVMFTTFYTGCMSFERIDIESTDGGAVIAPYYRIHHGRGGCPAFLGLMPHTATLTFRSAGDKVIGLQGLRLADSSDDIIEVTVPLRVE